ncbi:telomere zinc finger-associated protein isoform X2 [Gouania willdenowi]|nr:telomere zinc finger-associated protein isoform X2 [Gouania willdenowi]XP_028308091.1 telomere zinc finger-associated protein isoform X2 [Gouania willdenowi]
MPLIQIDHARRLLSSLNQQRTDGRFCDTALNVGDGTLHHVHGCVLSSFSELFQQPITELRLQGCSAHGLRPLLDFVYTGELKLDPTNVETVREAASSLRVPEALALCVRFQDASGEVAPVRRKRGRPRKCVVATVKEENQKDEFSLDECGSGCSAAVSMTTTTTKTTCSGRVVKAPKRLVSIDERNARSVPEEEKNTHVEQPAAETQASPLLTVTSGRATEEEKEAAAEEEDEDEDAEDFQDISDDTDEDYVPAAEATPSSPAAQEEKIQNKTSETKNEDKDDDDSTTDSEKKKKCLICNKSFKSKYYLKVHNRRHTGERPFGCNKCGKKYFRKENLLMHEMKDCARVQTYSCPTCSSTFQSKEKMRLHVVSHTGEMPHKCSMCQEQFLYKKNLTSHMMKVHGYPKPHVCSQCPKTFLTRTEVRVHEAAKHRGEKPFVCEECGHRASSRNGLQMHIKAIHRNERPFVCTFCGHAFSQKNNLNMHLRIHSGERPYQCHLCGKTFRTQASLDKHQRTHTGERPFSCDVCDQRFTEKGALVRHKASKHEEGRPHCCQICSKTFKGREQLRVHLRRHKGMRKFECSDCGYKFTRQAHLRRHSHIHKRTENYNPRQRKLRNIVVQEAEGRQEVEGQQEVEVEGRQEVEVVDASLLADGTDFPNPLPGASSELTSTCIVRVVIGQTVMEEVVSNQSLEHVEAEPSFSVLQQTELDSEVYESTIDMEAIAEDLAE